MQTEEKGLKKSRAVTTMDIGGVVIFRGEKRVVVRNSNGWERV